VSAGVSAVSISACEIHYFKTYKMIKMKKISLFKAVFGSVMLLSATMGQADEETVKNALNKAMPTWKIETIKPAEVAGLYEVSLGGNIFYVSDNGKYLIQGHLIDIENRENITENKLAVLRAKSLKELGEDQTIIFKAQNPKYKVSVFTDIDCGYCRKLHSEIDQYLAEGITVQYLFFPRAGKGSNSYNKAVAVWCADNRNEALTSAKSGKEPDMKTCEHPVDKHMQLASEFGAQGTPMIVTEKGNVFPGYVPAKNLAQALALE
jgi:thiol:disulfide interchange protein DsbC